VIYTREKDELVELHRRAAIANQNHADLFISIHCNSTANTSAYGTETFVMGLHRSQANLDVAKKENAAILFEENYIETYGGFDPNSPEANIIFTLYQNAYLDQSLQAAALVQAQFREYSKRHDRGVKQAGFLVLYQVTMPAILIEAGFISNPREEEFLLSQPGQQSIATAIFRAFSEHKKQHDALAKARIQGLSASAAQNIPNQAEPEKPSTITQTVIPQPVINKPSKENEIVFKVQFATSTEQRILDSFAPLQDVDYYFHQGLYKYTLGSVSTLEQALNIQRSVQQAGYKDAFVVAFKGEERISTAEANRLLKEQQKKQ
jgi:N-acetylmuramoyl-L-alanine amidase